MSNCSSFYILSGNPEIRECVAECPSGTAYVSDGKCVDKCKNSTYTIDTSTGVTFKHCEDKCNELYVTDTDGYKQCVDNCPSYQSAEQNECQYPKCNGKFITTKGECADSCDFQYYTVTQNGKLCVESCTGYYRKSSGVSNLQCLEDGEQCAENEYLQDRECVSSCRYYVT